ncbi:MAG: hypothetical protein AAF321_11740 [Pseudomonadota bacterium]
MAIKAPESEGRHFLSVGEAAQRLGLNRLKVREAVARGVLEGRRDNRGHLRVDLPINPDTIAPKLAKAPPLTSAALLDGLFDEIEELRETLRERDAEGEAAAQLIARQSDTLAKALDRLESSRGEVTELKALLDKAFALLDRSAPATSDRDRLASGLDEARAEAVRAQRAAEARSAAMARQADTALTLLERAFARAEDDRAQAERLRAALDRSLTAAERMEGEARARADALAAREAEMKDREAQMETLLGVSERSLELAEAARAAGPQARPSLWRRLLGRA